MLAVDLMQIEYTAVELRDISRRLDQIGQELTGMHDLILEEYLAVSKGRKLVSESIILESEKLKKMEQSLRMIRNVYAGTEEDNLDFMEEAKITAGKQERFQWFAIPALFFDMFS